MTVHEDCSRACADVEVDILALHQYRASAVCLFLFDEDSRVSGSS